ncbi:MAG: hypothetical protein K6T83_09085, partial [Alicyclobacillus sp.]|nr:hypothetical protein [Alicyclobacillus sp.]
ALVRTYTLTGSQPQVVAIAAGRGEVVVQRGLIERTPGGGSSIISLPIHVYALEGTEPISALHLVTSISAPFGVMNDPVITPDGIFFRGVLGAPIPARADNEIWESVDMHGVVSRWIGPPVDGQPHWIAYGSNGDPYWVETTPAPTGDGRVEVLMAALLKAGNTVRFPASTLNSPVQAFAVSGGHVVWKQDLAGVAQLVVEQVN